MTTTKRHPWEAIAVDLIFKSKEPVTIAVLSCATDLVKWMDEKIPALQLKEPFFVYTYYMTLH